MTLLLHNTLRRRKMPFTPLDPGQVKIYVCGPTVYDEPHLGHARSAVVFDLLRRYLEIGGQRVTLVRNVTDIDDKIINKARRQDRDWRDLGAHYLDRYQRAMDRLNVIPPHIEPKASDFIRPMQRFIARLLQAGHAYGRGGSVYFAVAGLQTYGRLSGRRVDNRPGAGNATGQEEKRHPADFVLWKAASPGAPFWPSPWGPGRPGWHIACSAMSGHLLGEVFDIHGGGIDLIFPHHENEIAQSEALFKKIPARYWIHHGLVQVEGRKISKSLGRFQNLADLMQRYPPDALRLFLLSKRYRHPLAFSSSSMEVARKQLARLQAFFSRWSPPPTARTGVVQGRSPLWKCFCTALDDDLNFPQALSLIFSEIRRINRLGDCAASPPMGAVRDLHFICARVLGLRLDPPATEGGVRQREEEMAMAETV
jgi:cysteinyl-tRNA synthetase